MGDRKICYYLRPYGDDGSETKTWTDRVQSEIIRPAVEPLGYTVTNSDDTYEFGTMTFNTIEQVVDAPLVIADLSGETGNVFYALALRHVTRKAAIHLVKKGEDLSFDIGIVRMVPVAFDHETASKAILQIVAQTKILETRIEKRNTPVSEQLDRVLELLNTAKAAG